MISKNSKNPKNPKNIIVYPTEADYAVDTLPSVEFSNIEIRTALYDRFFVIYIINRILLSKKLRLLDRVYRFKLIHNYLFNFVFGSMRGKKKLVIYENSPLINYLEYLHNQHPSICISVYFTNPIKSKDEKYEKYRNISHKLISSVDSNPSNMIYNPIFPYKKPYDFKRNGSNFDLDLIFIGASKDRLDFLYNLHDYLLKFNLKFRFYVLRSTEEAILKSNIIFLEKRLTYKENLKLILTSSCVLDLVQEGQTNHTLRFYEALSYGLKVVSNVKESVYEENYYYDQFFYLENLDNHLISFLKNKNEYLGSNLTLNSSFESLKALAIDCWL